MMSWSVGKVYDCCIGSWEFTYRVVEACCIDVLQ